MAWAKHTKFPLTDRDIRQFTKNGPTEDILNSVHNFPRRLENLASNISTHDTGPFPLYHPDLYHSDIIVNDSFRVLGVIDWEGACTVPWELVDPPLFLSIMPPAMDDPRNYKANRQPRDPDSIQHLKERAQYTQYVQEKERELKVDQKLSTIILNPAVQGLAYAMKVYLDPGKLGFYCNVLQPFSWS